jgi:hypothetical protein
MSSLYLLAAWVLLSLLTGPLVGERLRRCS